MGHIRNAVGPLTFCIAVGTTAQARERVLKVAESVDAVRGDLSYCVATDLLQAVLISHHRCSDGSNLIAI